MIKEVHMGVGGYTLLKDITYPDANTNNILDI